MHDHWRMGVNRYPLLKQHWFTPGSIDLMVGEGLLFLAIEELIPTNRIEAYRPLRN